MLSIVSASPGVAVTDAIDRDQTNNSGRNEVSRAQRYEIDTAIRFRVMGESTWYEGMTENISISGVLIRADQFLEPNTTVEMKFFLPVELWRERAAEVFCRGVVVRSLRCQAPANAVAIASTIAYSRFVRQSGKTEDSLGS